MDVDRKVTQAYNLKNLVRQLLSKIAFGISGKASPSVSRSLVKRRLEKLRQWQAMVCMKSKWLLERQTDDLTSKLIGINSPQRFARNSNPIYLVAVNGRAQIEPGSWVTTVHESNW